ncbi:SAM-dependent methyltransferase [Enterococcus ureilyticus]|uniref:SAM-dependent methyltransferase n=1 Tax=Enterococcus ureilyticus TaxID=1131292 RepID=A0A1E5HFS8_9ENTE|nr:class I SAM-dependent methyltransferase [Enterococcus ureilyticus]MBM7689485.1 putative methyltransferase [Enterococcus ureilyticus]MBO0444926.1 methyltransferase domain-containing protein [Enterococcus ureilyticus]OEG23665.1 SAM-dependent methyltransferase [Enterococcus ureilyticus]
MLQTALHFSHTLLRDVIHEGDCVVDATMGNGHDTAFLAELVGPRGLVYAFDVQEQALANTEKKLIELGYQARVTLFQQGHEMIDTQLSTETSLRAAIFNLGYLPKGDKQIITKPDTTEQALDALLPRLLAKGRIILVVYYGHFGGQAELKLVQEYCQQLPQEMYNVLTYQFINQKNNPPILFCIEKK